MLTASVNRHMRNLKLSPGYIPKAIPGFSTKVILNKPSTTDILCPPYIPGKCILKNGIEIPLTISLDIWSIKITANETKKTLNINLNNSNILQTCYPAESIPFSNYLFSCLCFMGRQSWLCGTASSLALGISGQVSHRCWGSSIHSRQMPYVPESILLSASSR